MNYVQTGRCGGSGATGKTGGNGFSLIAKNTEFA